MKIDEKQLAQKVKGALYYKKNIERLSKVQKKWRRDHPGVQAALVAEWKKKNKEKIRAKNRACRIPMKPCEMCGTEIDVHRHHPDYDKPMDIIFLCRTHHKRVHGRIPKDDIDKFDTIEKLIKIIE